MNCIELTRNGTCRPNESYTSNYANGQYIKAYKTFLQKIKCDTGDKSISLTTSEWTNKYKLYVFKITDVPIEPDTYNLRFKSATGSTRLEASFAALVNENI